MKYVKQKDRITQVWEARPFTDKRSLIYLTPLRQGVKQSCHVHAWKSCMKTVFISYSFLKCQVAILNLYLARDFSLKSRRFIVKIILCMPWKMTGQLLDRWTKLAPRISGRERRKEKWQKITRKINLPAGWNISVGIGILILGIPSMFP